MINEIDFQDWDDEADEISHGAIGPTSLMELINGRTPSLRGILMGCPIYYLVNERYVTKEMEGLRFEKATPYQLIRTLERSTKTEDFNCSIFVSDNYTSHVITPVEVQNTGSIRLIFSDPWGDKSFLEEDNNIANIKAQKENERNFSISFSEFERVIVGMEVGHISESPGSKKQMT